MGHITVTIEGTSVAPCVAAVTTKGIAYTSERALFRSRKVHVLQAYGKTSQGNLLANKGLTFGIGNLTRVRWEMSETKAFHSHVSKH
jgi:hypothetical protein